MGLALMDDLVFTMNSQFWLQVEKQAVTPYQARGTILRDRTRWLDRGIEPVKQYMLLHAAEKTLRCLPKRGSMSDAAEYLAKICRFRKLWLPSTDAAS